MSTVDASKLVSMMNEAYGLLTQGNASPEEILKWLKRTRECLRTVRPLLRLEDISVGEKQRHLRCIGQLECVKLKFEQLLKTGGRLEEGMRQQRSDRVRWHELNSAFEQRIRTGVVANLLHKDTPPFLDDAEALFHPRIKNALARENALKVNSVLAAEFYKITSEGEEVIEIKYFNTKNSIIIQTTDLSVWFNEHIRQPILKDMEEFQERDSGWSLRSIINLVVHINKYNPMRGSSYIELPMSIQNKNACINVKNTDNKCFMWAILSALHPVKINAYRPSKYEEFQNELNFSNIDFPIMSKNVPKFEKQNNVSVNVYMLQKKCEDKYVVSPVHITDDKKDKHVNLLLLQNKYYNESDDEDEEMTDVEPIKYHYVWIKNLSRLVCKQLSKNKVKHHICDRCLNYFLSDDKLQAHEIDCRNVNKCKVQIPRSDNSLLKFTNYNNKEKVPFIVYADFECLLKKQEQYEQQSKTEVCQVHEAYSVGYYLKCSYDDTLSRYECYRGEKPAEWFVIQLQQLAEDVETVFWCPIPMTALTPEEENAFSNASICHICEKSLLGEKKVVRDHCHLTGKYRGPAHEACNINYQDSRTIPVVFHNLSGYDSHFIIKEISTYFEGRINLLPINLERYISFTKHVKDSEISFRFIDSFRFMASSLDKLASYLTDLPIVRSKFPKMDDAHFELLRRKGVFPYEFVDSRDKLETTTELPTKEQFYSSLTDSEISDENYVHAKRVWSEFNIRTLGEYSDLYLMTDVLLLAEVFENFRCNCLKAYGLDPAHYYTTPGLTWDAMLKFTKVQLQLITDIDMMMFVERGIRGGISQCSNRYAKANNKYMKNFDFEEESSYLMYFDVNNLYGWAMTQYLPFGSFKWAENTIDWRVSDESPVGYFLEVDLEYPEELHNAHSDLPLCAEQMKPPGSKDTKLLTTLHKKTRYVIHYRNLKQAVKYGLEMTKVHRILEFSQAPWLKSYIELNTKMRQQAKNDFEKNLYKLMNNAVFGKTMENVRKRSTVKLVTKWGGRYGAEALISKPNFHSRAIFSENLVGIKLTNTEVLLNKPIYVGLSVLDLSKTCVYDFHYGYMLREFKQTAKLLYTDTDSLIYEIKCPDVYEIMKRDIRNFDTSDYPTNNIFNMPQVNKKVVGLMKDECNGRIMTEFVGLRSKMYSVRVEGEDRMKKAKGVKTAVVQRTINFNDYVDCLRNSVIKERSQYNFRSVLHQMQTVRQSKIALSPHDDKRCLLPNTTDTLPWGHFRIDEIKQRQDDDGSERMEH